MIGAVQIVQPMQVKTMQNSKECAQDSDEITLDWVKAGKVKGDSIAVIVLDVYGSLIVAKGFGKGIGG